MSYYLTKYYFCEQNLKIDLGVKIGANVHVPFDLLPRGNSLTIINNCPLFYNVNKTEGCKRCKRDVYYGSAWAGDILLWALTFVLPAHCLLATSGLCQIHYPSTLHSISSSVWRASYLKLKMRHWALSGARKLHIACSTTSLSKSRTYLFPSTN